MTDSDWNKIESEKNIQIKKYCKKFVRTKKRSHVQSSLLGKMFDSKFLPSIFASSKAFQRQIFSCLFLLAAHIHD